MTKSQTFNLSDGNLFHPPPLTHTESSLTDATIDERQYPLRVVLSERLTMYARIIDVRATTSLHAININVQQREFLHLLVAILHVPIQNSYVFSLWKYSENLYVVTCPSLLFVRYIIIHLLFVVIGTPTG